MTDLLDRLKSALADRYTIERELGRGGMATVYLAKDLKHGRQVALKLLKPELNAVLGSERFLREIHIAASLNHPHVLPLLDSGEAEQLLYYVMPFVAGESLRQRLERETQLPIEEGIELTRQVAAALDYAHRQGVVHRDIKPENILLQEGQAVVADFGIARALRVAGGERLTETGLSLGTPAYMSPEQASGTQELDGRSDVYALACVLYEMLVGDPPFTGPTVPAIIARQLVDPVPSLRTVRPTVPEELERAIKKALAKVPADRYPTAGVFVEACGAAARVEVVPTRERRVLDRPRGGKQLLRWVVPLVAGAALAVAVIAAVLLWSRGSALDPHLIAVAPFDAIGSELEHWRDDGAPLLATRLEGAGWFRTVPASLVQEHWAGQGDRATALRLADQVGAGLVLFTKVVETGDSVRLSATLVDAVTGDTPEQPEVVGPREPMDALVDSLATRVLAGFARSRMPPLARWSSLGSSNPRAIKEFLTGEMHSRGFRHDSARQHYERAIAEDPTFALAYRELAYAREVAEREGDVLWSVFTPWGDHDDLRLKAGSLNQGLALRESLLVVTDSIWAAARTLANGGHVRVGSEADSLYLRLFSALDAARLSFRQDPEVLSMLARLVLKQGAAYGRQPEDALQALTSVGIIDSASMRGFPVGMEFWYHGREAGLQIMERYLALAGDSPRAEAYRIAYGIISSGGEETPDVRRRIDSLLAEPELISDSRPVLWRAFNHVIEARVYPPGRLLLLPLVVGEPGGGPEWLRTLFGRVREARAIRDSLAPPQPPHLWKPRFYPALARLGVVPPDIAARNIRDYVASDSLIPLGFRWWLEQGDTLTLMRAIEVLRSNPESHEHVSRTPNRRVLDEASAHLALLRGDTTGALALLTAWRSCRGGWCSPADYTTAQLLAAAGRLEEADALSGFGMYGSYEHALFMQHALLRGHINEQLDRPDVAARSYQLVVDFWGDGDPEVQPWVEQARAGLRRLGRDAGS